MTNIILASASPRRKKILEDAGLSFDIIPSQYDEKLENNIFSKEKIENIAFQKANEVAQKHPHAIIISADTVVVFNNKLFTKPKDKNEAFAMLETLSGETHFVQTSVCVIKDGIPHIISTITNVTFNNLTKDMINKYIDEFKPFDKAGAYGIQELPDGFIKNIDGDLENVIGISSSVVINILNTI